MLKDNSILPTNTMTRFHIPSNLFQATGIVRVRVNPKFYRPTEVEQLLGDCTKAKNTFGWVPKVGTAITHMSSKPALSYMTKIFTDTNMNLSLFSGVIPTIGCRNDGFGSSTHEK